MGVNQNPNGVKSPTQLPLFCNTFQENPVDRSKRNMVFVVVQPLPPFPIQPPPHLSHRNRFRHAVTLSKGTSTLTRTQSYSSSYNHKITALTQDDIPPNALRRKQNPQWRGGFSLGVDLGMSRTGVALSKGFSIRPLTVLELRGQKLELRLLEIAEQEEADEFIIGLPKSIDGKETSQSNVVRSVAGRFAVRAAERGWRVYLQNEHGTSTEALDFMIDMGLKKSTRQGKIDAYAAMMVLERYFSTSGEGTELVLPKDLGLQEKIQQGPPMDLDFYPGDLEEHSFINATTGVSDI